jgi:hypothetical protein
MTFWAVTIDLRVARALDDDELGDLVDLLDEYGAAVAASDRGLSVTLTVDADTAHAAHAAAEEVLSDGLAKLGPAVAGLDAVEVMTVEEQDRRLAEPAIPQLAGVTEVAEMLGVTRQRASALTTHPAAPAPVARLASGPVYVRDSWCRFAETWPRRGGRPRRAS